MSVIEKRINMLNAVFAENSELQTLQTELEAAGGDWAAALDRLKAILSPEAIQKLTLAHSLAEWTNDNIPLVKHFTEQEHVTSLRDVALNYDAASIAALVEPDHAPKTILGATLDEKAKNFAIALNNKLFAMETSAVLQRMALANELPIADANHNAGVAAFLDNQPEFNIRTTSVYSALKHPEAFANIPEEHRDGVVHNLKVLQRVQAISPVPEATPALMKANLTSAFQVAEKTESAFLRAFKDTLGEQTAREVYTNAINAHIRNEHALTVMRETVRGSGLAIIDGKQSREDRVAALQKLADDKDVPFNLSTLFGGLDYCECDECHSVYSPASYFVELLQYLRNNNLDPNNPNTDHKGIAGTPLEKLIWRRPDLGCLELTCENTYTVLPYVDLANEVMESFIVHLGDYIHDNHDPKRVKLDAFNVEGETTSELLAQPQHTNYQAYCVLKNAVYPFTLPYHQPIDAARIFLNYAGTSRWEILDTFRTSTETCPNVPSTPDKQEELRKLHQLVIDRAVDAEFLGMTQEEYIILTREAFWPLSYFVLTQNAPNDVAEYEKKIGVRQVCEYYGYVPPLNGTCKEEAELNLPNVKKQFLPRTGIQYTDLVELLQTRFINPNYPQGQTLTILDSIRFSYRFLQTLVDTSSTDPQIRYAKLIAFLEAAQPLVPILDALLHPDPCKQHKLDTCVKSVDFRNWVYCYFEKVGRLVVLDAGEGPQLPIEGRLMTVGLPPYIIGTLHKDGWITDLDNKRIGKVTLTGHAVKLNGQPFTSDYPDFWLKILDDTDNEIGFISVTGIYVADERVTWLPVRDTCNLDKVRLIHLDGTPVSIGEYDRMQRFIRLWRKTGWTIDEVDQALVGLACDPVITARPGALGGKGTTSKSICECVNFGEFVDVCASSPNGGGDCGQNDPYGCSDIPPLNCKITPEFLHQLAAVRKLLDLTGQALPNLLALWGDIGTRGAKSLYAKLFLTHNLTAMDPVFKADANGNYLTQPAKISEHLPVLMAALKLKAGDIDTIMKLASMQDELTLSNVSILYRCSLLAKILRISVSLLADVVSLFGNPFNSAWDTLNLLQLWNKMLEAGFSFRQLNYLIAGHDDLLRPIAPSKTTILKLTKTLFDGLNAIDGDNPDITQKEKATSDIVRDKAGKIFDQPVTERIIALLEGTTLYTTNAPKGLNITIPDLLSAKVKYIDQPNATPPTATLQVTGILNDGERDDAKAISPHPEWVAAVERICKQPKNIFNDVLVGIFLNLTEAQTILLAGDYVNPADPLDDANTAPKKRLYFLQNFLPFLREQLAQRLVTSTTASAVGLPSDVTFLLLSDIILAGNPQTSAMKVLEAVKTQPPSGTGWTGYLIPKEDAEFTFVAISDTQPAPLVIDGQSIAFSIQQEDPTNVWFTDPSTPVKLKAGKLYTLKLTDRPAEQLQWKTARTARTPIPASNLLPDYASEAVAEAFVKLLKAAIIVNGFNISVDETGYLQNHASDFDGFDFNAVTLQHWKRLQAYAALRNGLPRTETSLLDLFAWASSPNDPLKLSEKIAAATTWKKEVVKALIAPDAFDLEQPSAFRNEINLVKLRTAVMLADKIGVGIAKLFEWATPGSKFWTCHKIAEDIRNTIRARFTQNDWEQVVKPLSDQLRAHQKQALIDYLLVQQELKEWGVIDADSLFEFFLIDVQMEPCMQTSRIKQAISSVQLFVQRCMLGLETKKDANGVEIGVTNDALDRDRWNWMQRYRVWEANRKVFLYPENWLIPELRDDKSSFYKELESELLQKDVNDQTVQEALKAYLVKVDEVANLRVVGLFVEGNEDKDKKLHVCASTRQAPYFYYYRYYDCEKSEWYPWEKIQVDIPSYGNENLSGTVSDHGTFVTPVALNGRLLIFFPQIIKKTIAPPLNYKNRNIQEFANNTIVESLDPAYYYEIKMCWSERRNGKWTQKQISPTGIHTDASTWLGNAGNYYFVSRILSSVQRQIIIDCYHSGGGLVGAFCFHGNNIGALDRVYGENDPNLIMHYHYEEATNPSTDTSYDVIYSLQAVDDGNLSYHDKKTPKATIFDAELPPVINIAKDVSDLQEAKTTLQYIEISDTEIDFYHPFIGNIINKLDAGTLTEVFNEYRIYYDNLSNDDDKKKDVYGGYTKEDGKISFDELRRAYSLYNWEATFHAPMLLVERLLKAQQFEQALKMCHHILSPFASGDAANKARFWQFPPFKEVDAENVLENLFLGLKPRKDDPDINKWRENPFQPHVVARGRPAAYMKWVATTYIKILIEWGDYLFRQDTIESINQATQLYILASHIYGPGGYKIPKRGKVRPETYNSLLDKWDAFGNAMVELELAFPFSNQTQFPIGISNGVVGLANIFGFATTLYFCIPDNPNLRALRDTIDDRLFKIRHCENIAGIFRQLPLFEPPIDPALLVQAAAQGLSIASVLNDLNSPMPNYRFTYLLQKALEICNELKSLGGAFLSAKEKGDGEAMAVLRAKHESAVQNLVMEVKKLQVEEAQKSIDALEQARLGPVNRMSHYLKLIGDSDEVIPDENANFGGLKNHPLETPVSDSGLQLLSYEKEEMDKAAAAADWQLGIGATETLASILHVIPSFQTDAKPFGIGMSSVVTSGWMLGNAAQAVARGLQIIANDLSFKSTNAGRKAGYLRQLYDRIMQANSAGYEIKNIDKQILTQKIRLAIANLEINNQQKQIDNAQEAEEFLRSKYTNQELYSWMEGQVRTLYYQAYTLAYDIAKKAEKVFRFERCDRDLPSTSFVQSGYWDPAHDGLFAGERLYVALKHMEAAYQEKRGYDFEIVKNISLLQLTPLQLIRLRETDICEFELPEFMFDMGYPGHFLRRIKSVALTVACHVGPATSVNCTLRLMEHKIRKSDARGDGYPQNVEGDDERFTTYNVPITAIAVSTGQNDSGVFELNFRDERYIPFEGAGAISKWRIELPDQFHEFDYSTITDVVMHLRYTSVESGSLKRIASDWLADRLASTDDLTSEQGLFAYFDIPRDFANSWRQAQQPPQGSQERVIALGDVTERLPAFTKQTPANKIIAKDIYILTSATLNADEFNLNGVQFGVGDIVGKLKKASIHDFDDVMTDWTITINDVQTPVEDLFMVVRYTIE